MKKILTILAAGLAMAQALHAQTLTLSPGFTETPLFTETPGTNILAMGSDASGNIYYIDTTNPGSGYTSELVKRTAASSYATSTVLYTYSGPVYGDFVKVSGSTVYFGESSTNTIQSISVNGGSPTLITTLLYNYDLAFSGSTAFISAANANFQNAVSELNLTTGALTTVLQTNGASGPISFGANGTLYYGASTYGDPGGIYAFSAAQVAAALAGTPLQLSDATPIFDNGPNQYLASQSGSALFQANTSFDGGASPLQLYNPATLTFQSVGQIDTNGDGDNYDGLALVGNGVAVGVSSQYGQPGITNSEVFLVTPEPGSAALLAIGAAWMIGMRRCRSKRRL